MSPRVIAIAAGVAYVLAATAPANAAEAVRIVSPKADAYLTSSEVKVRVRTSSRKPRLDVRMYGRGSRLQDVTGRFHRIGRRTFEARLRAGGRLRFGRNYISAAVKHGADARRFTVARRARERMTVRRVERRRSERPPLDVHVRSAGSVLRARLNGRDARESFEPIGRGRWTAALTVRHGLRFGRNRLVVTVFDGGRFQRERRTYIVGRDRPLADAGRNRRARAGDGVRLDGSATRAARRAGLRLRWEIVRKPRGSRPQLRNAAGARPRLATDAHGTYGVRLLASHRRRTAGASAAQSAPAAADTVEVDATPSWPPRGMPIKTLATQSGEIGIELGGSFHAMDAGAVVQLLALDRSTLEVVAESDYAPGQEQKLLSDVNALSPHNIAILSGGGRGPYSAPQAVQQAIQRIGGKLDDYGAAPIGRIDELTNGNGGWSVIGVPEVPQGQAYQMIGLQQGPGAPVGGMSGAFQAGPGGYAFTWTPEYHTFDTQSAATPTSNAIQVDGMTFSSSTLPFPGRQGKVGFQLVWLDADTLQPRANVTFDADINSSYDDIAKLSPGYQHGMWGLRDQLRQINADPKPGVLLLNTIGTVPTLYFQARRGGHNRAGDDGNDASGDVAARVATLLESFGANSDAYILMGSGNPGPGSPGGYSLVGVTGLRYLKGANAGAEMSTRLHAGSVARLAGLLKRSRQGVLQPGSTGSPGPGGQAEDVQPDVQRILAQPESPFPPFAGPEQAAAEEYIGCRIEMRIYDDFGIRSNYWLTWDGTETGRLNALASRDDRMTVACGGEPPCSQTLCAAGFDAVMQRLSQEFSQVDAVQNHFGDDDKGTLYQVFDEVFLAGNYDSTAVIHNINTLFNPPQEASTSGPNALSMLSGALGLSSAIGEFVPGAGEIAEAGEVMAGVTEILEMTTSDESTGAAEFDPYGYNTTVADLTNDLESALESAEDGLAHVADLLVSDAGRLAAAADEIAEGGWHMDSQTEQEMKGRLLQNMRQFIWLTMAQPVLATYECALEDADGVTRHNPAAVLPTNIAFPHWPRGGSRWNLYYTTIMLGNRNHFGWPDLPSSTITTKLFGEPDYGDQSVDQAGFRPEYLLARARAGGGEPAPDPDFNRNIYPVSQGLVHKNMTFSVDDEDENGLSLRDGWSAYTPTCGHGQRISYSDPDPHKTDSPYFNP